MAHYMAQMKEAMGMFENEWVKYVAEHEHCSVSKKQSFADSILE